MREIKFRGKRINNGEWAYGSLLQSEIDVNKLAVRCQIHERFADNFSIICHDVVPETVGQYIGVNDNYEIEIYEGDILQCYLNGKKIGAIEKVEFEEGNFILRHRTVSLREWNENKGEYNTGLEVIGNIFESA